MKIYAVLMAGGVGTRFWPRSRTRNPKQVLNIINHETMIQSTFNRLKNLIEPSNIFVVTTEEQREIIQEQLPNLSKDNFILEPFGRNTAPCIGLAAIRIQEMDADAVMLVLPADHLIANVQEFEKVIKHGAQFASESNGLITLGITPSNAATGYGYVQRGEKVREFDSHSIYKVKTFAEKPNRDTAIRFLESGDFYWNSGMFIWQVPSILKEIEVKLPELYEGLQEIRGQLGKSNYAAVVEDVYRRIRSISIDYGVMQTAQNVYIIPTDMGWNDVGSWEVVYEISEKDKSKNAGEYKEIIQVDSGENYVYSPKKLIALVGIKNLVVVDTGDALLICKKQRSQDVKDIVEQLKKSGMDEYI
ncbi:MAG: mannose-1-phosphate guanylyltransferase [Calditrichia bacterium]